MQTDVTAKMNTESVNFNSHYVPGNICSDFKGNLGERLFNITRLIVEVLDSLLEELVDTVHFFISERTKKLELTVLPFLGEFRKVLENFLQNTEKETMWSLSHGYCCNFTNTR